MKRTLASIRMDTSSTEKLLPLVLGGGASALTLMLSILHTCTCARAGRVCAASLLCALT